MEVTDLKAPEPALGIPPWQDPRWLADAQDWIDAGCARASLARTGSVLLRARPYSVVGRVPTDRGNVWFKASPPPSRFEPALLTALAVWRPDRFTAPIAVAADRAWALTRDGGPTLREHLARHPDPGAWQATVRDYARLQLDLVPRAGDLLALGLPDLRPASVPGQLDKLLADPAMERVTDAPGGISRSQHHLLRALAPQVSEWCAELRELGIPASLDHADVHPGNIFAATGTPFDWGDATLAHPFASLWVILRTAAGPGGLPPHSPGLAALTETYRQPWLEAGHPRAAVDRALLLALRIAPLARALVWGRLFPCYLGHPDPAGRAARALAAMLEPHPVGLGELE
jgi:Phosphotransferase enzyme family